MLGILNLSSKPEVLNLDAAFALPGAFKKCLFVQPASIQGASRGESTA